MAFEDGDLFVLQKRDTTPEQHANHTDPPPQSTNTHAPIDEFYCLLVTILSVF